MTQAQSPAAAGQLSRVTLAGARRRIDLVLPADEPLGLLLPEIVAMVGHRPMDDSRGYQISTLDGTVLDPAGSLRQAAVPDGAMLRVDPISEAPPAAIVHDVADEVGDDLPGGTAAGALPPGCGPLPPCACSPRRWRPCSPPRDWGPRW